MSLDVHVVSGCMHMGYATCKPGLPDLLKIQSRNPYDSTRLVD